MDKFFVILEEEFNLIISQKNGWGKNEVMTAFHKAFAIAVSKYAGMMGINLT
jgi:hypothetical protein